MVSIPKATLGYRVEGMERVEKILSELEEAVNAITVEVDVAWSNDER